MPAIDRSGSQLIMPTGYNTQDLEQAKFSVTNGTVVVNTVNQGSVTGEDTVHNVQKVEQQFSYWNTNGQAAATISGTSGLLHTVTINTPLASGRLNIFDGPVGGTSIGQLIMPGTLLSTQPFTIIYDAKFNTSLSVQTQNASQDITITYR